MSSEPSQSPARSPLFSRTVLWTFALIACVAMVLATWYLRGQWSPTLPLPIALVTLGIVLPVGEFIRNRFKLSLRSMIVLLTVCGVLLGLFGVRWNKARLQRNAIESVRAIASRSSPFNTAPHISVHYDRTDGIGGDFVRTPEGWIVPSWLVNSLGEDFFYTASGAALQFVDLSKPDALDGVKLSDFPRLHFNDCRFGPKSIKTLAELHQLTDLSFSNCAITDQDLAKLTELPNLERLRISNSRMSGTPNKITAGGLKEVAKLKTLTQLELENQNLTSGTLTPLHRLSNLEFVNLSHNPQLGNDEAMALVKALTNLKGISFADTAVNEELVPYLRSRKGLEWASVTPSNPAVEQEITAELERDPQAKPEIYFR